MFKIISPMVKQFLPFAQKRMGFKNPPKLFLRSDDNNAEKPLGKTAYYDPDNRSITVYITGRHPKDVMRSISHELVHHSQNCRGEFDKVGPMGDGYAQNDEHLREMEREAYEVGNMCFRDWEDSVKNTTYFEHLQKGEKKMSTKDWKNKEVTQLLAEAWGFKFNSLDEFNEFSGEGELQAEGEEEAVEELAMASRSERPRKPKLQRDRRPDSDREDKKEMSEGDEEDLDEGEELDEGTEEELDEQSKSDLPDRGAGRAAGGRRLDEEEEELDEAAKKMVKCGDKGMVPDYACDGKGADDLKSGSDSDDDKKDDDDKKNESVDPLQEAIANLLRKHLRG
mgnify:CR=1 FL=1